MLSPLTLVEIHQGSIEPYIEHRREQDVKSSTVVKEIAVVRRILILASRVWRDSDNQPWLPQAPLLRMPDWKDAAKPYPLSDEEQIRFFNKLPDHLAEMVLFALHTGVREHLVAEFRWEWEHPIPELKTSVFLVLGEFTKNSTPCLIVLSSIARQVIEKRRRKMASHVFGFCGKPVLVV